MYVRNRRPSSLGWRRCVAQIGAFEQCDQIVHQHVGRGDQGHQGRGNQTAADSGGDVTELFSRRRWGNGDGEHGGAGGQRRHQDGAQAQRAGGADRLSPLYAAGAQINDLVDDQNGVG